MTAKGELDPDAITDLGPEAPTDTAPKGPVVAVENIAGAPACDLPAPFVVVVRGPFGGERAVAFIRHAAEHGRLPLVVLATAIDADTTEALAGVTLAKAIGVVVPGESADDLGVATGAAVLEPGDVAPDGSLCAGRAVRVEVTPTLVRITCEPTRAESVTRQVALTALAMATSKTDLERRVFANRLARMSGNPPVAAIKAPVEPPPDLDHVSPKKADPARAKPEAGRDVVIEQQRGFPSPDILWREAARASRQWRTYASRAAFSGVLMAIVLVAVGAGTQLVSYAGAPDPANFGSMGRNLFIGFAVVQTLVAMIVSPLLTARAVIEEREERTLEIVVLSRITPRQIFLGKIASSLLLVATLVIGALPVLSLVTSLGGVSVVEVVAATFDAMAALVVLGVLGAFFALFTRSQVLAAAAALGFALPAFIVVPWLFVTAIAEPNGATWVSPLYGTAAIGWNAILPVLAFLPLINRALNIGSNVFAMRVAQASHGRLFRSEVWRQKWYLWELAALGFAAITIVPAAVVGSWTLMIGTSSGSGPIISVYGDLALRIATQGTVWLWTVVAMSSSGWLYMRLGAEWVMALESMIAPSTGATQAKRPARKKRQPAISGNPVLWHESRLQTFGSVGLALVMWVLAMWGAFQSLVWVIPGGLLVIGAANAIAGWLVAAWLGVSTFERERREGTLELLMTSTMPNHRIVVGKAFGVAVPSLPLVLVAFPLLAVGVPHASLLTLFDSNGVDWGSAEMVGRVLRGASIGVWAISMWGFSLTVAMAAAVRMPNPRQGYAVAFGAIGAMLLLPWMASVAFDWFEPAAIATRLMLPILAIDAPWWEPLLPSVGLSFIAVLLGVLLVFQLRTWSAKVLA